MGVSLSQLLFMGMIAVLGEQTMVITAQSCAEMACTRQFITPQGRKTKTKVMAGRSYIMELSTGFQTATNSEIQCQGQDILLNGSIQKGIVSHVEYAVQVETEVFTVEGSEIRSMSSSELLACNLRGLSQGCVCALHTYEWNQPADSCTYKLIREVEGY